MSVPWLVPCWGSDGGGSTDASAEIPGPIHDRGNNSLLEMPAFDFPNAPTFQGGTRDVAAIPDEADGRHEQTTVVLRSGRLRITAPTVGRAFSLGWDAADMPYALIWQSYRPVGAAFWGTADTFAIEPSTAPGRSMVDAVAANALRYLAPGKS